MRIGHKGDVECVGVDGIERDIGDNQNCDRLVPGSIVCENFVEVSNRTCGKFIGIEYTVAVVVEINLEVLDVGAGACGQDGRQIEVDSCVRQVGDVECQGDIFFTRRHGNGRRAGEVDVHIDLAVDSERVAIGHGHLIDAADPVINRHIVGDRTSGGGPLGHCRSAGKCNKRSRAYRTQQLGGRFH